HRDKEGPCAQGSSVGWLLQSFMDGISLRLNLHLWDMYLLEGEQVLTPMACTAFKVQRSKSTCEPDPFVGPPC
uniref:Rab-GAP TBC domain-containing protein n=1 Tax=Macaca nemestrina TaxID=9545 RepID=A0A2K6DHJ6_MACNE